MAGLEGTVKTPFGEVSKKTALIAGAGVAVIGFIVYYRHQQSAASDASVAAAGSEDIDPATGYAYGSPEDAAALASQSSYVVPTSSGSSTSSASEYGTATTNAQWVQEVLSYVESNDIGDASTFSVSLGKYISGQYATDNDVSLINQAIAINNQPPVAGANGYPPSINRTPPTSGTGTTTTGAPGAIQGKKTTTSVTTKDAKGKPKYSDISTAWTGADNAVKYEVYLDGKLHETVLGSPVTLWLFTPGVTHTVGIRAIGASGAAGPLSSTTTKTASK